MSVLLVHMLVPTVALVSTLLVPTHVIVQGQATLGQHVPQVIYNFFKYRMSNFFNLYIYLRLKHCGRYRNLALKLTQRKQSKPPTMIPDEYKETDPLSCLQNPKEKEIYM